MIGFYSQKLSLQIYKLKGYLFRLHSLPNDLYIYSKQVLNTFIRLHMMVNSLMPGVYYINQ